MSVNHELGSACTLSLQTSYFARTRMISPEFVQCSIALYPPRWFKGHQYTKLAPSISLLEDYRYHGLSKELYTDRYMTQLNELDPQRVYQEMLELAQGNPLLWFCWERSNEFCHRHLAATWLMAAIPGLQITELDLLS